MPQPAFHLTLARDVLETWHTSSTPPPFPLSDPSSRLAFLHGSLGPDLGFFPGAPRALAHLAHHGPTGDLTRELLERAEDDRQAAFAWGWATHVLADALIHPIVNRFAVRLAAGSLHDKRRIGSMHIRIEIGLDLLALQADPALQRLRLDPVFRAEHLNFIATAFAAVHGVSFPLHVLLACHRRVTRFTGLLLFLQRSMLLARLGASGAMVPPVTHAARAGLNTLNLMSRWLAGPHSESASFLQPQVPCAGFREQLSRGVAQFHREFQRHAETRLGSLPNYNLEDGTVVDSSETAA